jgi:ribosome maturation factor RimP
MGGPRARLFVYLERIQEGLSGVVLEDRIVDLIGPGLDSAGYRVVRVRLTGGKGRRTLQIMIDRNDDAAITVDDCADASRLVSAILDVEDPIDGHYILEMSSPGIDRPLTREADFVRWAGFDAKIELRQPQEGQRRFRGRLIGCDDGIVTLRTEKGEENLPIELIAAAKLILTDELVAAHENQAASAAAH